MLCCDHISFTYENAARPSVCEITTQVTRGTLLVLTGKSGCGKTTISRIINGLIPELYEGELKGHCLLEGGETTSEPIYQLSRQVGSVFQNPKTQFFTTDVSSELAFPLENMGMDRDRILRRLNHISALFGIDHLLGRSMFALSGGEKQTVAIASSCMANPDLLVLDEPSSNLDVEAIEELRTILSMLKGLGMTLVLIEHRLYYLDGIADDFLLLQDGRIVDHLSPNAMRNLNQEERGQMGLRALRLDTLPQNSPLSGQKGEGDEPGSKSLLSIKNLTYSYQRDKRKALQVDDLTLSSGEVTGIIGRNGAGKTTFANLLTGLLKPDNDGALFTLDGQPQTIRERLADSYMVFQDVNYQLFCETVGKEMLLGAKRKDIFQEVATKLDLDHLLNRHPNSLSEGEKQRVAIAAAILSGRHLVVLDEPTSGLDLYHMIQVSQMIRYMHSLGVMVIIISHDQEFLNQTCQRFITFREGKPVRDSKVLGNLLKALE